MEESEHRLLYLFFELTRRCNLSCLHCGSDCGSSAPGPELGLPDWIALARSVAVSFDPKPFVVFTGGEPLLLDWIEVLGAELTGLGIGWGLVSNGLLLSETRLRALEGAGISSLTLSIDGLDASHDWLRGREGSWRTATDAARILGHSSVPIRDVVTCVHPRNAEDLDGLAEVLVDAGVGSWRLFRIFRKGRALSSPGLLLGREGYLGMLDWIAAQRPVLSRRGLELSLSCDGWLPFSLDLKVRSSPFLCRSGINFASILADGSITGCSNNDPGYIQGSIAKDELRELWNSAFRPFRDRSWLADTSCAGCCARSGCRGGSFHAWSPGATASAQCWETP